MTLSFIPPAEEHAELLLDWRTRPDIAGQQMSEVVYDIEHQKAWLSACATRADYVHRLLCVDGEPVGYCSITLTHPAWRVASVGVLVGDRRGRMGDGPLNFAYMLNHVFFTLGQRKVVNHIFGSNDRVLRGQPLLGYRHVGTLCRQVLKDGAEHDLEIFEMLAEDWLRARRRYGILADMDGRSWPDPA